MTTKAKMVAMPIKMIMTLFKLPMVLSMVSLLLSFWLIPCTAPVFMSFLEYLARDCPFFKVISWALVAAFSPKASFLTAIKSQVMIRLYSILLIPLKESWIPKPMTRSPQQPATPKIVMKARLL